MPLPPPESLMRPPNLAVFAWLRGKSAHSDPAGALRRATEVLPDVDDFTPDGARFAYYVVFRAGVVFAFVEGMRGVTLRLPPARVDALAARGATRLRELGDEWVFLALYETGGFDDELAALAREAHAFAPAPVESPALARDWHPQPGATPGQIGQLLAALPFAPPSAWIAFLRLSNGGEGELSIEPGWFQLWDIATVLEQWNDREDREAFPDRLFFGGDGGLESFAFDVGGAPPWPVVTIDPVAGPESERVVAPDFEGFARAIGSR